MRCIADGEVVAYRINKNYPAIEFRQNSLRALYSTGFTLVRHQLVLPQSTRVKGEQAGVQEESLEDQATAAQMDAAAARAIIEEDKKGRHGFRNCYFVCREAGVLQPVHAPAGLAWISC